jgi:hypothetical protein
MVDGKHIKPMDKEITAETVVVEQAGLVAEAVR